MTRLLARLGPIESWPVSLLDHARRLQFIGIMQVVLRLDIQDDVIEFLVNVEARTLRNSTIDVHVSSFYLLSTLGNRNLVANHTMATNLRQGIFNDVYSHTLCYIGAAVNGYAFPYYEILTDTFLHQSTYFQHFRHFTSYLVARSERDM